MEKKDQDNKSTSSERPASASSERSENEPAPTPTGIQLTRNGQALAQTAARPSVQNGSKDYPFDIRGSNLKCQNARHCFDVCTKPTEKHVRGYWRFGEQKPCGSRGSLASATPIYEDADQLGQGDKPIPYTIVYLNKNKKELAKKLEKNDGKIVDATVMAKCATEDQMTSYPGQMSHGPIVKIHDFFDEEEDLEEQDLAREVALLPVVLRVQMYTQLEQMSKNYPEHAFGDRAIKALVAHFRISAFAARAFIDAYYVWRKNGDVCAPPSLEKKKKKEDDDDDDDVNDRPFKKQKKNKKEKPKGGQHYASRFF